MKNMERTLTVSLIILAFLTRISAQEVAGEEGLASWYGSEFDERPTSSGEAFNSRDLTAAHPSLPFGTMLRVTNTLNSRQVIVRVNDRGPFGAPRIIDISTAAAEAIGMIEPRTAPVLVEVVPKELPVSTAALPSIAQKEIGYRTIKVGETKSLADMVQDKSIVGWTTSTPSSVTVNPKGDITGLKIGNAFVNINEKEYIAIVVVPVEEFYIVPESQAARLPESSSTGNAETTSLTEYRTEPTFRLAYRFNNKGEGRGASGPNGGIDILARGENYEWLWTTYCQGGWFYDLNGIQREMINGYQKDERNGVELTVLPEFVYDQGIPYLQLRHRLPTTAVP